MNIEEKENLFQWLSADIKIIARKTELWKIDYCEDILHDIKLLMDKDYLAQVTMVLRGNSPNPIRANRYIIQDNRADQKKDRPGSNDWDGLGGVSLNVVLSYTDNWHNFAPDYKATFEQSLKINWSPSSEDIRFPSLQLQEGKQFSSSSFSIKRIDYK